MESINDLDTTTIPEGGTNISSAIDLAMQSFGKSATGNRALIFFTDGEELSGDAAKVAKAAADAGVRIFTVGVGTPQGSLIPLKSDDGGTAFVKDADIDARLGRRPIERYEWPLGAAMLALTMSILIGERRRVRVRARVPRWSKIAVPATALILILARPAFGTASSLSLYREGKYNDAYRNFEEDLK